MRTADNITDRLSSIKSTIKYLDNLCEEKPYRTEKCQQYIDSLCSTASYYASKKNSFEDLMMAARSPSAHSSRSRSRGRESGIRVNSCKDGDDVMSRSLGFLEPLQGIYGSGKRHLRTSPQRSQYGSTYDLDDDRKDTVSNYRYSNVVVGGGTNADREKEITSLRVRENLSLLPKHDAFSHCNHKSDKYYPDTYFPKYTQDIRDEKYEELLRIVDTNKYLTMTMTMTMTTASSTSPTMMHCYSNSNLYPTQNANESFSPMSNALKVSESRNVQSLNLSLIHI